MNFRVLVCITVLHNQLEIKADLSVHCYPDSHGQITVGQAEGLWDRSGATLRTQRENHSKHKVWRWRQREM